MAETKRKIGSKNRVSHSRPIGRFDLNGDLVAVYSSASEASRELGISKSCICRVAKGERKVSLKSTWRYLSGGEDLSQLN